MMYVADLTVLSVIKESLKHLQQNPDELEFLFSQYFTQWPVNESVGDVIRYIAQVSSALLGTTPNSRLEVKQGFSTGPHSNYSLYGVSSGGETQQFLGDYGSTFNQTQTARVYATATYQSIQDDQKTLVFSSASCLSTKLWRLQVVTNKGVPDTTWQVADVVSDDDHTYVTLSDVVPEGAPVSGWTFQSPIAARQISCQTSMDSVTVNLYLRTTGDIEIHKLFCMVIRYALKWGRHIFESQNYQVSKVSYSQPTPDHEPNDVAFITTFSISGNCSDWWIIEKTEIPDKISFVMQVESVVEGNDVVELVV